jgi:hypothetical protein
VAETAKPVIIGEPASAETLVGLKPLTVPEFYASNFHMQGTGNQFTLIMQRAIPMQNADEMIHGTLNKIQIVATVTMSPQTAKDLYLLLGDQIENHEKTFGVLTTPYTKVRQSQRKA